MVAKPKPTCLKRQLIMVSYVSLRGAQPAGHGGIGHKISMKFSPDLLTLLCLVDFPRVTGVRFSLCGSSWVALSFFVATVTGSVECIHTSQRINRCSVTSTLHF